MSSEKVKIKDLPSKNSILGTDIFIESDTTNTYKVTAENISAFVVESDTLKNAYVDKSTVGINGGITPLNDNGKVNGTYIQYGTTSNTAYEGSAGKILETNLDNHLTDEDAHGFNSKLNTLKGAANGLAELDENGKVPSSQLPSFVDDVLEGNATDVTQDGTTGAITATGFVLSGESTECAPESGKIYIDVDTGIQYRWSGTIYVTTGSNIALGETSSTAYRGDRGKIAYERSQSVHARTDAPKVEKSSTKGNIKINGTETIVYTHPSGTNPHGTTKSDVGLGNVGNFKAVSTVANQGLTDTEKSNARANIGAGTSSFSGSYNDLTNKPTIPTVGNGTITIIQNGTTKGTFTMNQSGDTTIELTDNNTTYTVATQTANGLESDADKTKLDGIETGAEVNQNAFSNVVVGTTTIAADSKTDTLTLAGSNVTLTPDVTNDKVTIEITKDNVVSALGYTPGTSSTDTNTTYTLSKSGSTITLTGSDGSTTSVTDSSGSSGGGQIVSSTEPSGQNIGDHWLKEF